MKSELQLDYEYDLREDRKREWGDEDIAEKELDPIPKWAENDFFDHMKQHFGSSTMNAYIMGECEDSLSIDKQLRECILPECSRECEGAHHIYFYYLQREI